ncbi:MAG: hypothetical protein OXI30_03450 [Chloroflexota bacterium]|nr:hypothetical protein [Chloroflexota bacterium]
MTALGRILFCIACLVTAISTNYAQDRAIRVGSSVDGELAAGETHRYSLTALELTLVSFRVEALSDGLDPKLEIFDHTGALVVANDDYAYPDERDAAIQAFVIPRTSNYTILVSAFGESAGAYRLHVLPGYDRLALHETTVDSANWETVYSNSSVDVSESSVFALEMRGLGRSAGLVGLHLPIETDLYFEASFDQVGSPTVWQVGLLFRYLSPSKYHRLLLSKLGYWRIDRIDGEETTQLRNWTAHPAIRAGETAFRLGVLVSGNHYEAVYNGQVVGSAWDRAPLASGSLGIAFETDDRAGGPVSFVVAETLVTAPTRINDRLLFPERVAARGYYGIAAELARQQLVPVGGDIKLALPESSVRRVRSGISRFAIASDFSFAQFAFGVALTIDLQSERNGGCGLFFHFNDDENYTLAYVTSHGEYGLSRRTRAGFEPGIYGNRGLWDASEHYLLVIVSDEVMHYFVDEQYAGSLESIPRIGGVGIAAVNYDEVETGCHFDDLWLLSLDE